MAYILYYLFLELNCSVALVDAFWQHLSMRYKVRAHMQRIVQEVCHGFTFPEKTKLKAVSGLIPPYFCIWKTRLNYVVKAYYAFDSSGAAVYRSTRNYRVLTRQEWTATIRTYVLRTNWIENLIALLEPQGWEYTKAKHKARNSNKDYYLVFNFEEPMVSIEKWDNRQLLSSLRYSEWTGYSIQESHQEKWTNIGEEEWWKHFNSWL